MAVAMGRRQCGKRLNIIRYIPEKETNYILQVGIQKSTRREKYDTEL